MSAASDGLPALTVQEMLRNPGIHDSASWATLKDDTSSARGSAILSSPVRTAALRYLSLAIVSPFSVASVLLSVQYLPRPSMDSDESFVLEEQRYLEQLQQRQQQSSDHMDADSDDDLPGEDETDHSQDQNSEKFYEKFEQSRFARQQSANSTGALSTRTDAEGYLTVAHVPKYQLHQLRGSYWSTVKTLASSSSEGLLSLWKGLSVQWLMDGCISYFQPRIEETLNDYFDLYDPSLIPLVHQDSFWPNLSTRVLSYSLIETCLTPLALIRTRMMVQSLDPLHRQYRSPIHCLWAILRTPGLSWIGILRNLFPNIGFTVFYHTIVALIQQSTPLIIHRLLKLSVTRNPYLYGLAFFTLSTLELLIRLPMDTVRRRLFIQQSGEMSGGRYVIREPRSASTLMKTCVRTSDRYYWSAIDCAWHIVSDESIGYEIQKRKRTKDGKGYRRGLKDGWIGGVMQLYRGFWFHTKSNMVVSILTVLSGVEITEESDYLYF